MKRKDVAFVRFTNLQNVSVWKDLGQSCKGNGMRKIDQMNVFQVLYWIAQIYEPTVNNLSIHKELMTCVFYATHNALKSFIM